MGTLRVHSGSIFDFYEEPGNTLLLAEKNRDLSSGGRGLRPPTYGWYRGDVLSTLKLLVDKCANRKRTRLTASTSKGKHQKTLKQACFRTNVACEVVDIELLGGGGGKRGSLECVYLCLKDVRVRTKRRLVEDEGEHEQSRSSTTDVDHDDDSNPLAKIALR